MTLMSLGLVRGLVGQVVGTLIGFALIIIGRLLMGYDDPWYAEGAWALGSVFGTLGFLVGVGAMHDWFQWMVGRFPAIHHGPPKGKPAWTRYFGVDYNHKIIGIQYGVTSLVALMIGVNEGLSDTALPQTAPVFLGMGALAASSMILPGISGSYILLVFGMYDVVVGSIRPSELLEHPTESLAIVVPVGIGVVLGIGLLSNVLKIVLARWSRPSHGALLGLLLGSVLGLWPFREAVHPRLVTRPGLEAVEELLAGKSPAEVESATGVAIPADEAAQLRATFAGASRGDLKRAGLVLRRFEPGLGQVAMALGLVVAGFLVTLLLAPRGRSRGHA